MNAILPISIFDLIESRSSRPEPFEWQPTKISPLPVEVLYEGKLIEPGLDGATARKFVLTINSLYGYKDTSDSKPFKILKLKNPRIEKIQSSIYNGYFCFANHRYGFKLSGYIEMHEFYCSGIAFLEEWFTHLKRVCILTSFSDDYVLSKQLGKGCFGNVHLAFLKTNASSVAAVKIIQKSRVLGKRNVMEALAAEINVLRVLDHPNIIKLLEVHEDELYLYIVMEYLKGGNIFEKLKAKGLYPERDAALAMQCILEGLNYLGTKNVMHRDLKLDNLLLV